MSNAPGQLMIAVGLVAVFIHRHVTGHTRTPMQLCVALLLINVGWVQAHAADQHLVDGRIAPETAAAWLHSALGDGLRQAFDARGQCEYATGQGLVAQVDALRANRRHEQRFQLRATECAHGRFLHR